MIIIIIIIIIIIKAYPAHAPFGGYKKSGFGRETHKMMLNHYRQTKNMLISYDKNKLGFF